MAFLKKIWRGWVALATFIGSVISTVIMTVFYYTLFALFALPARIAGKGPLRKHAASTWLVRTHTPTLLADLKDE